MYLSLCNYILVLFFFFFFPDVFLHYFPNAYTTSQVSVIQI